MGASKGPKPNRTGERLGDYKLIRWLGEGGFADVYLGEHILLVEWPAAIKVLKAQLSGRQVGKLFEEAQTIARLEHPHIVRLRQFGVENGIPFLVMTYAPNGTLLQRHPRGTPIPSLSIIVDYVKQIAKALDFAHGKKVVHRDVKPGNMLVGDDNQILLSDFGISIVAQSTGQIKTHDAIGTPQYMAPEQFRGEPQPASDQYSLGIVVYEWLSGHLPFRDKDFDEFRHSHQHLPPPRISGISPELEQVMMKALAKDPKDRFTSVLEFAAALEGLSPVGQPTVIPGPPVIRPRPPLPSTFLPQPQGPTATVSVKTSFFSVNHRQRDDVLALAWSPDSTRIASISRDRTEAVQIWDAKTAENILSYESSNNITAIAWSPNGSQIALVEGGKLVQVRDTTSGDQVFSCKAPGNVKALMWLHNALRVACVSDNGEIEIWNITGTSSSKLSAYRGYFYLTQIVAWAPDGTHLAFSPGPFDKRIYVWNISTGNIISYDGHASEVDVVAWAPGGSSIASADRDKTVHVWNAATGRHLFTYPDHSEGVEALAWSPDSTRIASAGDDQTVQVWNATTGKDVFIYLSHFDRVTSVAWSPDGQHIASGSKEMDRLVRVWQAPTTVNFFTYHEHSSSVSALAWSPRGTSIASAEQNGTVEVWEAMTGQYISTCRGHSGLVNALAWSPDGRYLASAGSDKTIQVWDITKKGSKGLSYPYPIGEICALAWSDDNSHLFFVSQDGKIQNLQVGTSIKGQKPTSYPVLEQVNALAWSPDRKRIAFAGKEGMAQVIRVWNIAEKRLECTYRGHFGVVHALAWSPDGRYIASGSNDRTVHTWEAARGTPGEIAPPYQGHAGPVRTLAWSPHGQYIASAGYGTVQVWNVISRITLCIHHAHFGHEVNALAWSPDSRYIASAGSDKTVRVCQVEEV